MTEQQPDPLLQALRSHGTHFFLFLMICANGLSTALSFCYGATICAWLLSFLSWLLAEVDFYVHRDLLATIVVAALVVTLTCGLTYRLFEENWSNPRVLMLSITMVLIVLWFLLEVFGVTFGHPGAFVAWIPPLHRVPFPNPFPQPFHLWPFWQWTGLVWAVGCLSFTHRRPRSPRPEVNIRKVRVQLRPPEPEPGVDPFHVNSQIVDTMLVPKAPPEPSYREETRFFPLSTIHEHEAKWNLLEQCYKSYHAALERFSTKPIRHLRIPPQASDYASKGHIGWNGREPVFPAPLLHPSNAETLAPWLAHELAFYNHGLDLWVRDLLAYYPNEVTKRLWLRILIGNFLVLPTAVKVWYMPGWEHDRVKDGDLFSYCVGQGPNLKRLLQTTRAEGKKVPSSASLNPDSPTLSERIGQIEGLINQEHAQMREYGFVPLEPPLTNGQEQRPQIDRRTRKPESPQ